MRSHRRDFLKSSLAASTLVSLGASTVPSFLSRSASAASLGSSGNERILVVVQLLGGNDGLNTVVPHGIDGYSRGRRALRIAAGQIHKITPEIGLHPSMGAMAKLIEDGKLSVVQGVGYPNPDRSHFRSMEIWETARVETGAIETGWLGRTLDARPPKPGDDPSALHVGSRALPLALKAKHVEVPSLNSLEEYRLNFAADADRKRAADRASQTSTASDDPLLGFLRRSTLAAYESSRRLEEVTKTKGKGPTYPNYGLARRLELIAQVIKASYGTKIYYTTLDGFDTHANQLAAHAGLLNEFSDSVAAFRRDLEAAGQGDRVAIVGFSEFGRRVLENASLGTDHGAAAPVFVVGPVVKAGLVGAHPSFEDLDDGDLKHSIDFRRIYASLLQNWLGCPAAAIVGEGFAPLELLRSS
jgi:uncharacterized protein (DUF1501 family)